MSCFKCTIYHTLFSDRCQNRCRCTATLIGLAGLFVAGKAKATLVATIRLLQLRHAVLGEKTIAFLSHAVNLTILLDHHGLGTLEVQIRFLELRKGSDV